MRWMYFDDQPASGSSIGFVKDSVYSGLERTSYKDKSDDLPHVGTVPNVRLGFFFPSWSLALPLCAADLVNDFRSLHYCESEKCFRLCHGRLALAVVARRLVRLDCRDRTNSHGPAERKDEKMRSSHWFPIRFTTKMEGHTAQLRLPFRDCCGDS